MSNFNIQNPLLEEYHIFKAKKHSKASKGSSSNDQLKLLFWSIIRKTWRANLV